MQSSLSRLAQQRSDCLVADAKVGGKCAQTLGSSQSTNGGFLVWCELAAPRHLQRTHAVTSRSRGEAGRERYRSVLCLPCHDAVTTSIPVASATAFNT